MFLFWTVGELTVSFSGIQGGLASSHEFDASVMLCPGAEMREPVRTPFVGETRALNPEILALADRNLRPSPGITHTIMLYKREYPLRVGLN